MPSPLNSRSARAIWRLCAALKGLSGSVFTVVGAVSAGGCWPSPLPGSFLPSRFAGIACPPVISSTRYLISREAVSSRREARRRQRSRDSVLVAGREEGGSDSPCSVRPESRSLVFLRSPRPETGRRGTSWCESGRGALERRSSVEASAESAFWSPCAPWYLTVLLC